ncbi:MAG: ATP-binding protein [Cyanobacteriota bacterium]|nr:ATP-binding protein [Cyanobacteriota bacterium]
MGSNADREGGVLSRGQKRPLYFFIVAAFSIQVFAAVGLTGYLSFRNGQKAVNQLASQLRSEIADRIAEHLRAYLTTPRQIDRINVEAYRQGALDLDDPQQLLDRFWRQGLESSQIGTIGVGTREGRLIGANRSEGYIVRTSESASRTLQRYQADDSRELGSLMLEKSGYDPRQRGWYRTAVAAGGPTWTQIEASIDDKRLDLSSVYPFYDGQGLLQGVFFVDISLSQIGQFLQGLRISPNGQAFILEPDGALVASSTLDRPFSLQGDRIARIDPLDENDNTEIAALAQHLQQKFGQLDRIANSEQLTWRWQGQPQFVQVTPFEDEFGLNWSIVVVIPEADFMAQIHANTYATIALCAVALVLSTAIGLVASKWISRPILRLSRAAEAISGGDLSQTVTVEGADELEVLAAAFNDMVGKLKAAFDEKEEYSRLLEVTVDRRTQELQQEIEERKLLEQKLLSSEEKMRAVFEGMTDIVLVLDAEASNIEVAPTNPGRLYSPDRQAIQRTIDCFYREPRPLWLDRVRQALREQQTVTFDYTLCVGGKQEWFCASISPMFDGRAIWVARNISPRKRAEEVVQQAKEAAEAASRAKSRFLANMSHELRSPLNAILGFAQLMTRADNLAPEQQESIDIIIRSAEHLLALINNVLSFAKIEAGRTTLNPRDFNLFDLLQDLKDMFELKAQEKQLQLNFERTSQVPQYLRADDVKLRQILINLLNNGIKFTQTGSISVKVGTQPPEGRPVDAATSFARPLHKIQLYFEAIDTGVGIRAEEVDLLFEPFVQTETGQKAHEGTGLGLSIARQFVELMGGQMTVESEVGRGTRFVFDITVDIVEAMALPPQQSARRVIGLAANPYAYRIAIVDDQWSNRQLLLRFLQPIGFEVREAANGQEAIELWEEWEPHLIWMDMRMPVMDGYEATQQIKATTKGQATAIIALTASTLEEERAIVLSAGCDDFVRKPFRESEIFETMRKHIGVRYVYARESQSPSGTPQHDELSDDPNLDTVSPSLRSQLERALQVGDMELIENTISQIRTQNAELAGSLEEMARDFDYDRLWSFLQSQ